MTVACPQCQAKLVAPDAAIGKAVRCKCGGIVPVPAAAKIDNKPAPTENVARKQGGVPSSSSAAKPSTAPVSPSYLDQLTERDLKQSEKNPYAPPPKASNSDAAALKTYVKDDSEAVKAKAASSNLVLLIAFNIIGFVINSFGSLGALVLAMNPASLPEGLAMTTALGYALTVVLFLFAIYDLTAAIGLIRKAPWGWWLALVGLGWGIFNNVLNAGLGFLNTEQLPRAIGGAVGALIGLIVSVSLANFLLQPETQKKFNIKIGTGTGWGISLGIGLVMSVILGVLFFTLGSGAVGGGAGGGAPNQGAPTASGPPG
ncbi:MAG: hypothetical protein WCI02_12420 [Planctomycetota bacterium]